MTERREQDVRVGMMNSILTTPHRDLMALQPLHQSIAEGDPVFYSHLAAWYFAHGDVRDHKELFIVNLVLAPSPELRDVGLALLRRLPPYQIGRVVNFIKGYKHVQREKGEKGPGREVTIGLGRNIPRSCRTEIRNYLRHRERDPETLDSAIMQAREDVKGLYARFRIKPSERAQAILFDDAPPPDSQLAVLKQIAKEADPVTQATRLVEAKIPFRIAVSVIRSMTPAVVAALIHAMSPQELLNNLGALQRRGAMDNPDTKTLIEKKLNAAKTSKRVAAFKVGKAAEATNATGALAETLDAITDQQVQSRGQISRPTAILIDKSFSMESALEVGRQLGAMISAICKADLYAYAFDSLPYPIQAGGTTVADWERAMRGIFASGQTSCGVGIEWMRRQGQRVEQFVLVTDGDENQAPRFEDAYRAYCDAFGVQPEVVLIKVGNVSSKLDEACARLGITPRSYDFKGDYYALTNVIPFLTRPSALDLLMEILTYPLPSRTPSRSEVAV